MKVREKCSELRKIIWFNMTLEVLRGNEAGDMVQLILDENTEGGTNPAIEWTENAAE